MRCTLCEKLSFSYICKECSLAFLQPSLYKRVLPNGLEVFSFYKYNEIKELLFSKHKIEGYFIYNHLAKNSFSKFANEFSYSHESYAVGIDDKTHFGYSHTAILVKNTKSKHIKPLFGKLKAQNHINYSGKSLQFRLENKRDFIYRGKKKIDVILVDDIVTTGTTLSEAQEVLKRDEVRVLFALTLADARD